jgi:hypothetical protein
MNWAALSPLTAALGLLAVSGAVLLLHVLRVRLRRVPVDTLLFFQVAAGPERRRTLWQRLARWLPLLVAWLLAAALWNAFADLRDARERRSTLVVVPADGSARLAAALAQARELAAHGLGPEGKVIAAGATPRLLWRSGEPLRCLDLRAADLVASGPSHVDATVRALRELVPDGEVFVAGGGPQPRPGCLQVWLEDGPPQELVAALRGAEGLACELWGKEAIVAGAPAAEVVRLPLPEAAGALELRLVRGSEVVARVPCPAPGQARAVVLGPGVPASVGLAVRSDPQLVLREPEAGAAGAVHVACEPAEPPLPRLLIGAGTGGGPRTPQATAHCPLPLSLRDLRRAEAPALDMRAGEVPWVIDAGSGAPLVVATASSVRIASWLLEEEARRDVPVLVAGSLRWLHGLPSVALAPAGGGVDLPLAPPFATVGGLPLLVTGAPSTVPAGPGTQTVRSGSHERVVLGFQAVAAAPRAPAETQAPPAPIGSGELLTWLLGLGLLLVALDLFLHARGRWP